jgi:hypothetical protein
MTRKYSQISSESWVNLRPKISQSAELVVLGSVNAALAVYKKQYYMSRGMPDRGSSQLQW